MGLDNLYRYAKEARRIFSSKLERNVGQIITRPYIRENGNYTRAFNRHDYSFMPSKKILDKLQEKNIEVISVGKINDIFSGKGISKHFPSSGDANGMDITIYLATEKLNDKKLIFTNLVQFDSHYGHRRDVEGYANNINLIWC